MERRKKNKINVPAYPKKWGLKEMEQDLLASGAIEITPEQLKQEPYVTYMKDIKRNGKFICD